MRAIRLSNLMMALFGLLLAGGVLCAPLSAYAVEVRNVAVTSQADKTQIIFNLKGSARDVIVSDQLGKPMSVTFQGNIAGKVKTQLKKYTWPNLSQIYYEERNGKVQLFIKRNVVGTVSVSNRPDSVVVNIPHYYYKAAAAPNEIAPGVKYTRLTQRSAQGPVVINVLEVDPKNPNIEITPALASGRMGAKSNVASMVAGHQAVAGINGSFFKPDKGIPLGILIINQELIAGPIYDRAAMGITPTNEIVMDRIRLAGEVNSSNGIRIRMSNINQPRTYSNQVVAYSSRWGNTAPNVPANGFQIQVRNGKVSEVSTTTPMPIPKDGFVLSGPGTPEMSALANLQGKNDRVDLNVYTLPDWSQMKHAIGGGPFLVKNGKPYVDLYAQHFTSRSLGYREPRSAVGVTRDGHLLLVTVDGRQKNVSVGMTLTELAYLMQKLGSVNAMNLDGGSSTQMAVYGRMINTPSAGRVGVSNSLIVRRTDGGNVAVKTP